MNEYLPQAYSAAVDEHKVKPLGQPELDVTPVAGRRRPHLHRRGRRPPGDRAARVHRHPGHGRRRRRDRRRRRRAADAACRARFATLTTVERPVADGDFVSIDLTRLARRRADRGRVRDRPVVRGRQRPAPGRAGRRDRRAVRGRGRRLPGTAAGRRPRRPRRRRPRSRSSPCASGRCRRSTTSSPSWRASSTPSTSSGTTCAAALAAVKRLSRACRPGTRCSRRCSAGSTSRCPDRLVEAQVADHFDDGHGDDDHRAEFEKQAREALTAQFVLDAIAAKEELSVGEGELTEYIVRNAPRYGMTPGRVRQPDRQRPARCPRSSARWCGPRRWRFVLEHATVTDESGRARRPRGPARRPHARGGLSPTRRGPLQLLPPQRTPLGRRMVGGGVAR